MPKYQCPECEAVLRRAEAIAPGKKIRCPKCEAVFPARAMADDEPEKEPAEEGYAVAGLKKPAARPHQEDDGDDGLPYAVIKEGEDEVKPEIHLGSLRDKFAKSTIGPAMFRTVIPANWLLRLGLFSCIVATFNFILAIWPIIFCEANPIRPFIRPRVDMMLEATLIFAFGGIMCFGASKMHEVSSYPWAIVGSIMALIIYVPKGIMIGYKVVMWWGPAGMLIAALIMALACVGLWCLIVLMNADVRAGFKERAEELQY
ncbi:MAG TPA: hypothetical protein VHR66_31005 [Gemmataceae bacterium]|jgi:phage FluMu protein Com|nr:hypothetical protein [Gemmataceae bacterium]